MKRRRHPDLVMHTDDRLAPGLSRRAATILVAVGLLGALLGSAGLFLTLIEQVDANRHSTNLTRSEVQDIKQLLAERKAQRDNEQAAVQAQLDAQARVLCGVVDTFLSGAHGPGQVVLARAAAQLHCAAVAKTPSATATSTSRGSSSPTASSTAAAVRPSLAPQPSGTSTTPPAHPTGVPVPPAPPLGLPLTTPVCTVIPLLC